MVDTNEATVNFRLTAKECESLHYGRFLAFAVRSKIPAGDGPEWRWLAFTLAELRDLRESVDRVVGYAKAPHRGRYRAVRDRVDDCLARDRDHVDR